MPVSQSASESVTWAESGFKNPGESRYKILIYKDILTWLDFFKVPADSYPWAHQPQCAADEYQQYGVSST